MAEMSRERDFVLAPNEFVFIQDQTKGQITVYVGPHKSTLAATDQPIIFDKAAGKFLQVELQKAVQLFAKANEGSYIVLENPAEDEKRAHPDLGTTNAVSKLRNGRKINIPGPQTFPLWPGQCAQSLEGHHLRTNQYLIVRVYNEEEANANKEKAVIRRADTTSGSNSEPTVPAEPAVAATEIELTMGKLLVIKGTDVSFYIPPTGIEVVPDGSNYVREAVTLERLEYCILLSEDGNKRYVKGPAVVFPEPTEKFINSGLPGDSGGRKFRAIELNPDMGLYIKVTASYEEGDKQFNPGDELFVTGKEQTIYFPRPEHSLIKYGEKEIHFGVAIPEGEARYVLDKTTGKVELVRGPQIFLPDPRRQVIVRRVLSDDEVELWFPGNEIALEYNRNLRNIQAAGAGLEENRVRKALGQETRRASREVAPDYALSSFAGDSINRGQNYTPPRTITLNTKFDGAVSITVWNGYAVLVVNKEGKQRVEVGPKTVLLEYDETLATLALSTGKPKTTDRIFRTVYLKVSYNQVSDIVRVVTKDMVTADIKLSYRVNFEGSPEKWFTVDNYVKAMCDHLRSMLRNAVKGLTIEELNANYIDVVRDTVLGVVPEGGKRSGRLSEENGSRVYDVEVLSLEIGNPDIGQMLSSMQRESVRKTLELASREQDLENTRRIEAVNREIADESVATAIHKMVREGERLAAEQENLEQALELQKAREVLTNAQASAELARDKAEKDQELALRKAEIENELAKVKGEVEALETKAKAFTPQLISALQAFGDQKTAAELAKAISPLAILGGESVADVLGKILKDTPLATVAQNLLTAKRAQ